MGITKSRFNVINACEPVQAQLVELQIKVANENGVSCVNDEDSIMTVICAACDNLNESWIITLLVAISCEGLLEIELSLYKFVGKIASLFYVLVQLYSRFP